MTVRKRTVLIALLLFGVASAEQIASRDLVGVKPEWRKDSPEAGCKGLRAGSGGGSGGSGPRSPNATLELVEINGTVFQRDGEIVATVKLVNTGKKDLWIPWQQHPFEFEPDFGAVSHFKELVLYLAAVDSNGKEKHLISLRGFSTLYSSQEQDSTQLQLKPGQAAQIRFASKVDCDGVNCWPTGADSLEVHANWWIAEETIDRSKKCAMSSFSKTIDGGQSNALNIGIQKLETRN